MKVDQRRKQMKNKAFDNTSRMLLNKSCPLSGKDAPKLIIKISIFLKDIQLKKEKYYLAELHRFRQKNKKNFRRL